MRPGLLASIPIVQQHAILKRTAGIRRQLLQLATPNSCATSSQNEALERGSLGPELAASLVPERPTAVEGGVRRGVRRADEPAGLRGVGGVVARVNTRVSADHRVICGGGGRPGEHLSTK